MTDLWAYEGLWQKAKLYARRAFAEERDQPSFPLWATLALEFLARATLARVHPVLVADPREPEYILYAFGYRTSKIPKSIPAKALFARCEVVAPSFTEAERKFCMAMIERRNEELHSGVPAFHDFPTSSWLAEYFRVCKILLDSQGRKLGHLFGGQEASMARKMIAAAQANVRARIMAAIAAKTRDWNDAGQADREERARVAALQAAAFTLQAPATKLVPCPACETAAVLSGEPVRASDPVAEEDEILIRTVMLPTALFCRACGLRLSNHSEVLAAGLGDQYTYTRHLDPADYYGLSYEYGDVEDYYDEYMNE